MLCELGVIENKQSNDKSSFFLIDNINIVDSQPHISKKPKKKTKKNKMATPIIEKNTSVETLSS